MPEVSINDIVSNEKFLNAWTGIPTFKLFESIVRCVGLLKPEENNSIRLSLEHRVMLTFIKLKTNSSFICIASIFRISESTVTRCFKSTLPLIASAIDCAIEFPSGEEVRSNLPKSFKPDL